MLSYCFTLWDKEWCQPQATPDARRLCLCWCLCWGWFLLPAAQVTKQSFPYQGTLTVTFAAKHQLSREAQPLSDPEFRSLWTQQVQPRATPSRPSLLLQQQEPQQLLHPASGADGWTPGKGSTAGLVGKQQRDCRAVWQGLVART